MTALTIILLKLGDVGSHLFLIATLFTMSISTGLILPLLLAHPSYFACALLVLSLAVFSAFGRPMRYVNSQTVVALILLFVLFSVWSILPRKGDPLVSILQAPVLLLLLIGVLLSATPEELGRLLRVYIVFCFIMALGGVIAWVLINWEIVDYKNSLWSLYEATAGRANRDEWAVASAGYSFPYYLGLVLTGAYSYDLFSFIFYRASGWTHEPTSAAAFIAPAIILLARERLFTLPVRRVFLTTLIAFWLACAAVGSAIAFLGLVVFYLFFSRGRHAVWKRLLVLVLMGGLFVVYMEAQRYIVFTGPSAANPHLSLFESKFDPDAEVGIKQLVNLLSPSTLQGYLNLSFFSLMAVTIFLFAVRAIRSTNTTAASFVLILVYFFLHSLKGSWDQLFASFFFMVFFFIFLRVHLSHWNITEPTRS